MVTCNNEHLPYCGLSLCRNRVNYPKYKLTKDQEVLIIKKCPTFLKKEHKRWRKQHPSRRFITCHNNLLHIAHMYETWTVYQADALMITISNKEHQKENPNCAIRLPFEYIKLMVTWKFDEWAKHSIILQERSRLMSLSTFLRYSTGLGEESKCLACVLPHLQN